jgi:excisionase family DNA binding protein
LLSEMERYNLVQPNFPPLSATNQEKLLTPAEVASLFRVDPKTVTRWAKAGKLTSIKTLGGHRRYKESEVKDLLKSVISNT